MRPLKIQNKNMAEAYPEKAAFLESLIERTVDLEEPFKQDYGISRLVDPRRSKVLPVLVPDYPTNTWRSQTVRRLWRAGKS